MGTKDSLMGRLLGSAGKFSDTQVAETLAMLVEHGIKRGASDIHIEPHERFVLVRYRIDGTLRGVHKLPRPTLGPVMAQLKGLAGLQVQETQMPQEGEYAVDYAEKRLDVHLSTMPVYGGEKAVLHLSEEIGAPVDLAELGFWGEGLKALKAILARPHGLILVSGPRHSGVSSTLFSLLKDLHTPMVSTATIETGNKHRLPGVNQTYLGRGMSAEQALQATLRQDPNIIMIDNIPDGPTANLAVHAATTGHMVLGGLRAESSVAAVLRVRHAGVQPFLLLTGLRASISQRLVRRLCPDCRERYQPTEEEYEQLETFFGMHTPATRKRVNELERAAAPAVFGDVKQLSSTLSGITHLWRPSHTGCEACGHSGYKGRIAVVEVLQNTDGLHKGLMSKEALSVSTLQKLLIKDGFVPMGLDGLVKALRGETTIAEIIRSMSGPA
jgi:type II secretory ATPase GspE/PulE/Tfp pilus assembly ATPase PilB-like protein